jgi:hypothetical protein
MRFNSKVDVLPYTSVFAYALAFRINWDIYPVGDGKVPFRLQQFHQQRSLHLAIEAALEQSVTFKH